MVKVLILSIEKIFLKNAKKIEWVLRVVVFGEFLGHGVFALQGKIAWIGWISQLTGTSNQLASQLLFFIGLTDLLVAFIVLIKPVKPVLIWAALWGFWTGLLRPIVGEPIWDFVERWANWGAPLALFFLTYAKKEKQNED